MTKVLLASMLIVITGQIPSSNAAPCGDINASGRIDITDAVYLINYIFAGGPAPQDDAAGDFNCSNRTDITDAVFMINYIFASGPAPCSGIDCDPNTITDQERLNALNAIDSVSGLFGGVSPDSLATALVAFLNSRDEYEAVGQQGTSVWARFDDGRMVMIPNNRFTNEPIDTNLLSGALQHAPFIPETLINLAPIDRSRLQKQSYELPSRAPNTPSYGLPQSVKAFCVSTLGNNCFQPGATYAGQLLENHGYELFPHTTVTVSDLWGSISDYGFFYIDSHGGVCEARGGQFITGIWTSEPWSTGGDQAFATDLDSARLVYMYAKGASGNGCTNQWRYAFTGKFVEEYMSFSQNSLVYISACYSDAPSLRAGFTAAGASIYVGWTMPVTALWSNIAGEFLVDRMLGANIYPVMENPKQRPFDIAQVYQDLKNRGWDWDHLTTSELRITELNPGFGLLAPSLRYAYVINYTDTLFLTGYFGEDPGNKGHVYVDGVEQTVYRWEPTFIWASIPYDGPGSAGAITVEVEPLVGPSASSGKKRKSNPINLTSWKGVFTYTRHDVGALLGTIQFTAHLRADEHSFREAPHTAPASNSFVTFGGARDGFASGSVSGQFQETFEYPDGTIEVVTTTWTGGIPTPPGVPVSAFESIQFPYGTYLLQGKVDGHAKTMDLLMWGNIGGQNAMTETVVSSLYGLISESELYLSPPLQMYEGFPLNNLTLFLSMDNGWTIIGDELNYSDNDGAHKLIWPDIAPTFTPDTTAAQ